MSENERSRRQSVVHGRGGSKFKNALQELAELRKTGGRRADSFDVKEEDAVYDEVDEDQYAKIVQKRREEGGTITKLCSFARNFIGRTGLVLHGFLSVCVCLSLSLSPHRYMHTKPSAYVRVLAYLPV